MKTSSILDTYQTWLTHREYSPATIQKYTKALARFFADTGAGDIPTRETVAAWRDSLTEKGYTPATVNAMLALQWAGWTWRGVAVWDKVASRPQKGRFRQQSEYIVWGSNGKMPLERNVGCLPGVFRYPNPQNRIHVTEKPLQLMRDVVQICEPGGRILDPFSGAGTTVLAAVQEGYEAVGIEMSDAYFQRSTERLKNALESEVNQN